jgi:hypothetical protein
MNYFDKLEREIYAFIQKYPHCDNYRTWGEPKDIPEKFPQLIWGYCPTTGMALISNCHEWTVKKKVIKKFW